MAINIQGVELMPFNYQNDVGRMRQATVTYWRRLASRVVGTAQRTSDTNAQAILPPNDRNCVAVVDSGIYAHSPAVAMNQWHSPSVRAVFPSLNVHPAYSQVHDTADLKHAEMKMLDHCMRHMGTVPEYIGISKPACLRCTVVLVIAGVNFNSTSEGIWNAGWAYPDFIINNEENLKRFIGDAETKFVANDGNTYEVLAVYSSMTDRQKREYISSLKSVQN